MLLPVHDQAALTLCGVTESGAAAVRLPEQRLPVGAQLVEPPIGIFGPAQMRHLMSMCEELSNTEPTRTVEMGGSQPA